MTRDRALALLAALPASIGPGLSDAEVEATEERFGFRFAADHRLFLQAGLPLGRGWPDWRNGDADELRGRLDWPRDGVLFDVKHGFWYPGWGEKPEDRQEALRLAETRLRDVPQLVPVYSHRYLPGIAGQSGHPVLSVYQTDIIYYGNDLADYLHHEFGGPVDNLSRARASVPFWSYFLVGKELREIVTTTPHDPYAVTAEEAVDHMHMLAIERRIGRRVGAGTLIQAALVALVLDTPALGDLAGLTRNEESLAHELFAQEVEELGLAARVPATDAEARWALVRWWLQLTANGSMNAIERGNLGAGLRAFLAQDDAHALGPAGQAEHAGGLADPGPSRILRSASTPRRPPRPVSVWSAETAVPPHNRVVRRHSCP
ncbi:hypothetical protein FB465_3559 [Kitasatospora atroaurantiaca]|uniref:Uncharacterized protein n=2 Tax=Kitasatospora atroaurantiaca TaxID=285545 RepID=A0A561ES96_9ACTN|nr:hypothetical protein FB465_3559 [Kitasatospora atroaurantiaca]